MAALVFSSGIAILWSACAWLLRKTTGIHGPGVSVLMRIPGMKTLTATPNWTPEGQGQLPVVGVPASGSGDAKDVLAAPITSAAAAK